MLSRKQISLEVWIVETGVDGDVVDLDTGVGLESLEVRKVAAMVCLVEVWDLEWKEKSVKKRAVFYSV